MGKFSCEKGKRGERELASKFRKLGIAEAYRSSQYCGSASSADVLGLLGIHAEVKRTENLSLYAAYVQAVRDSEGSEDMPAVFHRRNGKPWLVAMCLEDWIKLYKKYMNQ